ncbi:hypothetical protein [Pedobacter panaciterrae]
MKTIIKKYGFLVLTVYTLGFTSCTKFLDESDPSNFTVENYFTKPEHARSSVNAIYASMRDPMSSGFGGGPGQ